MNISFHVALLAIGTALLIVGVIGRIEIRHIIVGTQRGGARLCMGGVGSIFIMLSIASSLGFMPADSRLPDDDSAFSNTGTDYLWSRRYLTANDLAGKSAGELRHLCNEIYARRGYAFQEKKWLEYFRTKKWYTARYTMGEVRKRMNRIEIENIRVLLEWERRAQERY